MIVDGFLDWATRIDGIEDKVYSQPNSGQGIACHSVVSEETEFQDGIPNRFLSTEKEQDPITGRMRYTAYAAASCMFVLRKSGEMIQMHPITASTWTSGGYEGNTNFWAIEAEGGQYPSYGELLTGPAEESFIRLVTEWENHSGLKAEINVNILQHKQIAKKFGYDATACASDRYSNAWARINEGERYNQTVNQKDFEDLVLATFSGSEDRDANGKTLPREERLPIALDRMRNRADGGFGSVADRAESAYVIAQQGGGKHTHPSTVGENA